MSRVKYLCLVYGEEKEMRAMTDDECMAYDQSLRSAGRCLASEALQPIHTAATVRVRNGKVSVTDRSEEHTSELQSRQYLVCRLLLEKKKCTGHRAATHRVTW